MYSLLRDNNKYLGKKTLLIEKTLLIVDLYRLKGCHEMLKCRLFLKGKGPVCVRAFSFFLF